MSCITQVSFKITIRKRHVYIDILWPWKWNQYFYLTIWEDECSKIIFFSSFQLVTRLNSQNRNETSLLMNSETLICIWILAFPIGIFQVSAQRRWSFLFYFSSFHDYWHPTTLISLVHKSLGEMEWCEKRAFQLLKMRKMKVSRNKNNKCVTDFYWQIGLLVWRIILVITWGAHKRQKFTLISIKIMWIFKFFVYT